MNSPKAHNRGKRGCHAAAANSPQRQACPHMMLSWVPVSVTHSNSNRARCSMHQAGYHTPGPAHTCKSLMELMKKEIMQTMAFSKNNITHSIKESTLMSDGLCCSLQFLSQFPRTSTCLRKKLLSSLNFLPHLPQPFPLLVREGEFLPWGIQD